MTTDRKKVLFLLPSLAGGGAERVFTVLLRHLDRERFELHLGLLEAQGAYMETIPEDIILHHLQVSRVRYALPRDAEKNSSLARTNIYGYMLATVNPPGERAGTIKFDFREMKPADVPPDVQTKFGAELVNWCFEKNSVAK